MYKHIYVHLHIYIRIHIYVCLQKKIQKNDPERIYVYVHIYIYIYEYIVGIKHTVQICLNI